MQIAEKSYACFEAKVRRDGQFTGSGIGPLVSAVFEWGWESIIGEIRAQCFNQAAVAALDKRRDTAVLWLERARQIGEIK